MPRQPQPKRRRRVECWGAKYGRNVFETRREEAGIDEKLTLAEQHIRLALWNFGIEEDHLFFRYFYRSLEDLYFLNPSKYMETRKMPNPLNTVYLGADLAERIILEGLAQLNQPTATSVVARHGKKSEDAKSIQEMVRKAVREELDKIHPAKVPTGNGQTNIGLGERSDLVDISEDRLPATTLYAGRQTRSQFKRAQQLPTAGPSVPGPKPTIPPVSRPVGPLHTFAPIFASHTSASEQPSGRDTELGSANTPVVAAQNKGPDRTRKQSRLGATTSAPVTARKTGTTSAQLPVATRKAGGLPRGGVTDRKKKSTPRPTNDIAKWFPATKAKTPAASEKYTSADFMPDNDDINARPGSFVEE